MLDNIKTIVLLMFENRSFDHLLGHLSYDGINNEVDGLQSPLSQYANPYKGDPYPPFRIKSNTAMATDLPHELEQIAKQLNKSSSNGQYQMDGFVKVYLDETGSTPSNKMDPMGFYGADQVPISSFLASTYTVCDRWFAALPTSTQPNRTMAFCGDTTIDHTKTQLISAAGNIFDWMDRNEVKWRVYHDGLSFFILYSRLWGKVLGDNFCDYERMYNDFKSESDDTFPEVIVVEPSYADSPHFGSDQPNDNHPPLAIGFGEEFLRRTYQAITCNPKRWGNTLMIVYYDEHGGFFDHVPPPKVDYQVDGGSNTHFTSLGVRIPGILVSPFVEKGGVTHLQFDHTSILQLLAEKFTPGKPYSATVADRKNQGVHSLSEALTAEADKTAPDAPPAPIVVKTALGANVANEPDGAMGQAFEQAALNMLKSRPADTKEKYPELVQWKDAKTAARPQ